MEETTAYITADILKDVVTGSSGTAYMCKISGMDVAAKTGTTDSKKINGYVDLLHIIQQLHGLDMIHQKKLDMVMQMQHNKFGQEL